MKKLMRALAKIIPNSEDGENRLAVKVFYRLGSVKDLLRQLNWSSASKWPFFPGNYQVIHPYGQVAICTLTCEDLLPQEALSDRVAIIGTLITPNLGIERIIRNTISNPNIRYLVICGKDSPVFQAGQAIQCLFAQGMDRENRIIDARGHYPVLANLSEEKVNRFLKQVQLVDLIEQKQPDSILQKISQLKRSEETLKIEMEKPKNETFTRLKAGGRRVPLDYDKKGFFVITVDHKKKEITVKHYFKDNKPGFLIKGRSSESILLAILNQDLVSQMSHAGYLGAELAKAETALKLGLNYRQDRSLFR